MKCKTAIQKEFEIPETKTLRNSNIELLRIVAMMMIILFHIVLHCINGQLGSAASRIGSALLAKPYFSKKVLMLALIMPFGQIGNAVFILISGYFMANREPRRINLEKTALKLLSQMMFATVALMCGSLAFHRMLPLVHQFPFLELVTAYFFNDTCWFVGYYFLVIVSGKLFLNTFLAKLDRNSHLAFILTMFTLISFGWTRGLIYNLANGLDVFCVGIFLYALGGFMRTYNPFEKVRASFFIFAIAFIYALVILSDYNITETNIERYGGDGPFAQTVPNYGNHGFIPLFLGICIFELFRRIKIPHSKVINYLGAATPMVYLAHDIPFVYNIWNTQNWTDVLYYHPILFIGKLLVWAAMTFAAGVVLYSLYVLTMRLLRKYKRLMLRK